MTTDKKTFIAPSWINNSFIEKALNNNEEKKVEVDSCSVVIGTAPGDNYGSVIYRVEVKLTDGSERSLIMKTMLTSIDVEEFQLIFVRESFMLDDIIPRIQGLLNEVAPSGLSSLAAKCLQHGNKPIPYIIMEDFRPQGFRLADRKRGLGLRHGLLAIRALARYHAGGHVLIKKDPSLISHLVSLYKTHADKMKTFVEGGLDAAAQVCKTWPGFEDISIRLEKFKSVAMDSFANLHELNPEIFNVITHGDFWANNMMFRYDEDGVPCEHRMVDLQLSIVASPALDVLYFLTTSLSEEVSANHQDLLIREYYFALQEALSLLGTEAPSFETFLADIDAHGCHSLLGTICVHPIVKATTVVDMIGVLNGDLTSLRELYNSPEVKKYLQRVLPELARKGWLPAKQMKPENC